MKYALFLLCALLSCVTAAADVPLRVCTWSLLNYSAANEDGRTARFKTVLDEIRSDILVVQDITEQDIVYKLFTEALDPTVWSLTPFNDGPDSDNMLYFKIAELSFIDATYHATSFRDIAEYRLWLKNADDTLYVFSVHLTAGNTAEDETARLAEVQVLHDRLLQIAGENPTANIIVCGNFNFYSPDEPGYMRLLMSATSTLADPLNGWERNDEAFAGMYTQSTRTAADGACGGGATGGLDDRFDLMLVNYLTQGNYVQDSYTAFGNDGQNRLNASVTDPPNMIVSADMAEALRCASDHLPVFADFVFAASVPVREPEKSVPVRIRPMPATDGAVLDINLSAAVSSVVITDMVGRTVYTISVAGQQSIPLPDLAPGVYMCRIEGTTPAIPFVVVR